MKGDKTYIDIGSILDDVFEAAKDFGEKMKHFDPTKPENNPFSGCGFKGPLHEKDAHEGPHIHTDTHADPHADSHEGFRTRGFEENADYYPNFSYPPMNVYLKPDRSIQFEFALAGFDETNITLTFQGDYMVFSARIDLETTNENLRYFKRRLKLKDIDRQKYYVPADKFDQEKVKAVFRNGILSVSVPPRDDAADGVRIEIVREGS